MIYFHVGIHRMAPVQPISQSERKLLPAIASRNSHPRTPLSGPQDPRPLCKQDPWLEPGGNHNLFTSHAIRILTTKWRCANRKSSKSLQKQSCTRCFIIWNLAIFLFLYNKSLLIHTIASTHFMVLLLRSQWNLLTFPYMQAICLYT